jgi:hypothetical protein
VTRQPAQIATLADELVDRLFAADPFSASELALRQYDAEVPDDSRDGHEALRRDIGDIRQRADATQPTDAAEAVTKAVIVSTCERSLAELDNARVEYLVTAMPMDGPRVLCDGSPHRPQRPGIRARLRHQTAPIRGLDRHPRRSPR